jgi:hypothetical protein|tara:strand:- start:1683 stop:2180 length:498 start_codon:yes stop_codon:yes gene_type:complete
MPIKMYQNPHTTGFEVLSKISYSVDAHSNLSSASYLATNDFPDYAGMFYSPTEHETTTAIKYGNFEQDCSNLNEIRESLNGPPLEFYIPHSFGAADGVGRQDESLDVPEKLKERMIDRVHKEALNEIKKAQEQVKGKVVRMEMEEVLLLRRRKRTVVFESEREDI